MLIQDTKTDISTNRFGGNGDVIIEHYIDEKLLNDSVVMYARVILKPGCSLGYHAHNGNSETIVVYIIICSKFTVFDTQSSSSKKNKQHYHQHTSV